MDNLLGELAKKFPPKVVQPVHTEVKGIRIIIFNFRGELLNCCKMHLLWGEHISSIVMLINLQEKKISV